MPTTQCHPRVPVKEAEEISRRQIHNHRLVTGQDLMIFAGLTVLRIAVLLLLGFKIFLLRGYIPDILAIPALLLFAAALADQGPWFALLMARYPRAVSPLSPRRRFRVAAVTTYVAGVESLPLVAKTLQAMRRMRLPHDTWLLDESGSQEVRALCADLGVSYFTRRGEPRYNTPEGKFSTGTKHGNYNSWLDAVGLRDYEIIVNFDPDHVPDTSFLEHTLPYFEDESIGYVQTPQAYYNRAQSLVAGGAAEESFRYYSSVQMAAYGSGFPVVTGCHCLHRATALRSAGGFAAHQADDLLLTRNYQAAGWRGVYVPRILARGLVPADWQSYLVQQERWARSLFDLKFRGTAYRDGRLTPIARIIGYLQGYRYLADAGVALSCLAIVLSAVLGYVGPYFFHLTAALAGAGAVLFATNLYRQQFYLDPASEAGIHWRAFLLRAAKWPYTIRALADVLRDKRHDYKVTPKGIPCARRILLPHLVLAGVILAAWLIGGPVDGPARTLSTAVTAVSVALLSALGLAPSLSFRPRGARRKPGRASFRWNGRRIASATTCLLAACFAAWSMLAARNSGTVLPDPATPSVDVLFPIFPSTERAVSVYGISSLPVDPGHRRARRLPRPLRRA